MTNANESGGDVFMRYATHHGELFTDKDGSYMRHADHARVVAALVKERDNALAAFADLDASLHADTQKLKAAGIHYQAIREVLSEYDTGEASFGRVVELIRVAANLLAEQHVQKVSADAQRVAMERDKAVAERGEAVRLLEEARDSVEFEVQENHQNWGERLMHKQEGAIDLLARITAFLAAGAEGSP